jgi:hypothetical protein
MPCICPRAWDDEETEMRATVLTIIGDPPDQPVAPAASKPLS